MRKTLITVAAIGVVGFGSAFVSNNVHAETLSNVQDQRSEIKENLSDADAKIADVLIDLEEMNDQIARVEDALKENQDKMKETKENIAGTNDEVTKLEEEIDELEQAIEKRYDILKQRAVSYQKNGGNIGFLEVVLGSSNFGELISRVSAVSKITDSDAELMDKQEADKEEVEKKQDKAETKLADLEDMKAELEGMESTILAQKEQNNQSKKKLKKKEKEIKNMKAELEIKDSNLASMEADIRQSMAAARTARTNQSTGSNDSSGDLSTLGSNNNSPKIVTGNGGISTAINVGKRFIGHSSYSWGAKNPERGLFDCSGFVSWAYGEGGVSIPRSTSGLASTGTKVSANNMQPGDLVFFNTDGRTNGHVGIYLGGGKFIGSQSSTGVDIADMNSKYWSNHFSGHVRRVR